MISNFEGISFGRDRLAAYASKASESRGRQFDEPESPTRTPFQRDRDRVIHSTAFRRLKHKTQVFVYHVGDHFRTRLTHSIEVAQIARSLARALRVDEDLAEALALSHDFGHTPFGHTGEDVLHELMRDHGGFDHNAQSLRIVTLLERQYASFDGLNLTWETLEGLAKHNGPLIGTAAGPGPCTLDDLPETFRDLDQALDLDFSSHSSLEAQCAAIADDIAYNAHDLDDGLRAGLFRLDAIRDLPIARESLQEIAEQYPGLDESRTIHEVVRRQITAMVEDVIVEARQNLERVSPVSVAEVRGAGEALVRFSSQMAAHEKAIKAFLFANMYRAPKVIRARESAARILEELFRRYLDDKASLPVGDLRDEGIREHSPRGIADLIASMTDRFAIQEHRRLFDETPELR